MFEAHVRKHGISILIRSVLTKKNGSLESVARLYNFLSNYSCVKEWIMTPAFSPNTRSNSTLKLRLTMIVLKLSTTFQRNTLQIFVLD